NQFFSVNVLSAVNAFVPPSTSTSTFVTNNLWASIDDATAVDVANGNLVFNVYLNRPAAKQEVLSYTITDGTAKADSDYTPPAVPTVSFNTADSHKTLSLPLLVNPNGADAGQLTVTLLPSMPDVGIMRGTGTGTILYPISISGKDPIVAVNDVSAFENNNG